MYTINYTKKRQEMTEIDIHFDVYSDTPKGKDPRGVLIGCYTYIDNLLNNND
tara:strand:- start:1063 stop:1218 length:156 start_codon:yes stop_codon:yes gene_type:complete